MPNEQPDDIDALMAEINNHAETCELIEAIPVASVLRRTADALTRQKQRIAELEKRLVDDLVAANTGALAALATVEAERDRLAIKLEQAAHNLETAARLYDCPGCVEAAKDVLSALSEAGFVVVPAQASPKMVQAGNPHWPVLADMYRAMISAAQKEQEAPLGGRDKEQ